MNLSEKEIAERVAKLAGLKRGDVVGDFIVVDNRGTVQARRDVATTEHEADPCAKRKAAG